MPEATTDEVLQQLEEMRERAAREDAEFKAKFLRSLNRLRAVEGLPPIPELGEKTFDALVRLPNVVVSRDGVYTPTPDDSSIAIIELSKLASAVDRALGGSQ